uniref:Uncharacterized protein n=1 Tax=viral metagenome TaxID=1070528 RepID=A0A6C0ANF4_9ZZZZ
MSGASGMQMGTDARPNVLPVKKASGPGFLGPQYNPADEMLPPASIGVKRGGDLNDVLGAVKGVIYYGDMMGFGEASSGFTRGMPGLRPLGVNYFVNSGLTCSNGATMWEYVQTIPTGSALGEKVKQAIRGVGLPQLRGMAPGILEDAESALNPFPVINAVVGSGYPQCRLVKKKVGDFDGKIYNVDGVMLVDPEGLIGSGDGPYYQERWIQDREVTGSNRPGEEDDEHYARSDPIQLAYDEWDKAPKTHGENGCILDIKATPPSAKLVEPSFCPAARATGAATSATTGAAAKGPVKKQGFEDYRHPMQKMLSLSVAAISVIALIAFWATKPRK